MSPIIYPPQSYEISLALFTVLSQLAVGVSCLIAYRTAAGSPDEDCYSPWDILMHRRDWILVLAAIGLALFASLFHLGQPWRAPTAINHPSTSWLSREIIAFTLFAILALLNVVIGKTHKELVVTTAVVGALGVCVQAFTYAPVSMPAIDNFAPFVFFLAAVLACGAAFSRLVKPDREYNHALYLGLAIFAIAMAAFPAFWSQGGTVVRETSAAWLESVFYWLALVCVVLTVLVDRSRKLFYLKPVVPVLVLVGILAGRLVFFGSTIHMAANIGNL